MESKVTVGSNNVKFEFELNAADWEQHIEQAYKRDARKYKVPGFRPGHAPRKVIELHYGPMVFIDSAVDHAVNECYFEEISKHSELNIYGQPKIDFPKIDESKKDVAFAFTATVALTPKVELTDYKGIELEKIDYPTTDKTVEDYIAAELKRASRLVKIDRAAQKDDVVNIDYVGTIDGVAFEGGTATKTDLTIGSGQFIAGFEEQLIGKKAGDKCDVKVKFPDDYHGEEVKGKDAVFAVTVNEVKYSEIPELNDEFVKDHSGKSTVDEYKADIKDMLEKQNKSRTREERFDVAIKAIADRVELDIPEVMIDDEVENMVDNLRNSISQQMPGLELEKYLEYTGTTLEKLKQERRSTAQEHVKLRLVLRALIEKEKLAVSDDELNKKVQEVAESNGKTYDEYLTLLGANKDEAFAYFKNDLLMDKAVSFVIDNNKFVLDKAPEPKKAAAKKPTAKKADTAEKDTAAKKSKKETENKAE